MNDAIYATGEEPEAGDLIECLPDEGAYHPGHEIKGGEQYKVVEVDCGYVFFDDDYGWWPTRFALVSRDP